MINRILEYEYKCSTCRYPVLLFSLLLLPPPCPAKSISAVSQLAQYKTDPDLFPHLVRTEKEEEKEEKEETPGYNRQKRRILVRTKTPIKSDIVRPDINFLSNGKPVKAEVISRQSVVELQTTTSTPAPLTSSNSNSTSSTPFSWLTEYFPFNGLPTNIFSLSPMQWMGSTLSRFGNVVNHSKMGPHVLL